MKPAQPQQLPADQACQAGGINPTTAQAPSIPDYWDRYSQVQRNAFLLVLFLVGASNYLDRSIIGVVLEPVKREFHVSDTLLGMLSGISFALFYATLGLPVARWSDRGHRPFIITLSLVVWSLMTGVCGLVATFWQLVLARFGVGAGEAGAIPAAQSLLADYFSPPQRSRAMGIFLLSSAAGNALGLVLGSFVVGAYGWRAAFLVAGVAGVALTPLTHFILDEPRRARGLPPAPLNAESTAASVRALLAKPAYLYILAAMVVYFTMAYGAFVFIVSLMIRAYHLTISQAGTIWGVVYAVAAAVGSVGGGALADRSARSDVGRLAQFSGWSLIAATPFYELAFGTTHVVPLAGLLFVSTTLFAAGVPAMFSALHVVCGSSRRAFSVAIAFFFSNLIGLGLGPILSGALSDHFAARYGTAEGLRYAMMVMMVVLMPSGCLMLRAGRHLKHDAED